MTWKLYDTVAAARDLPRQLADEQAVPAGHRGVIVEIYGNQAAFEVEFIDDDDCTIALQQLTPADIVPVPQPKAATA